MMRATAFAWFVAAVIVAGPLWALACHSLSRDAHRADALVSAYMKWSFLVLGLVAFVPFVTRRVEDLFVLGSAALVWVLLMVITGGVRARRLGIPFGSPTPESIRCSSVGDVAAPTAPPSPPMTVAERALAVVTGLAWVAVAGVVLFDLGRSSFLYAAAAVSGVTAAGGAAFFFRADGTRGRVIATAVVIAGVAAGAVLIRAV